MHMKYREEADYRQAMDELCFSQVAKARMTRNLRQSLAVRCFRGEYALPDQFHRLCCLSDSESAYPFIYRGDDYVEIYIFRCGGLRYYRDIYYGI